jgi:hypothetical protein
MARRISTVFMPAALVSEVEFPLAADCGALDGGELFLKPFVDSFRILLVSAPERTLRGEAALVEHRLTDVLLTLMP